MMENKSPTALLADDDFSIRLIGSEILEQEGFHTRLAVNGQKALELYFQIFPEIVILDVNMPLMDGFETCQAIRRHYRGRNIPIMVITSDEDAEAVQKAYDAGATDFMSKPLNWLIFAKRIRYMLRANRSFGKLRQSQARLETAQRIAQLGNWEIELDKNRFYCSSETRRICGIRDSDQIGNIDGLLARIHPEDRENIHKLIERAKYRGIPFQLDHRILLPDHSERIVHHQIEIYSDDRHLPRQIIGTIQDITQRKQRESLESERSSVLEMIIRNASLSEIMSKLVQIAESQIPGIFCLITLLRKNKIYIEAASQNLPDSFIRSIDGQNIAYSGGYCAAAAYIGEEVYVADIASSPVWKGCCEEAVKFGLKSSCSVPFFSGRSEILGTVTFLYSISDHSEYDSFNILNILGKTAAVATEHHKLIEKLDYRSRYDDLTGLPNRSEVFEYLHQRIGVSSEEKPGLTILFIDLDRFKHVNDSFGHPVGDELLKQIACRLKEQLFHPEDMIARSGGDEFIYISEHIPDREQAQKFARKLINALSVPFNLCQHRVYVGASVGISMYPEDGDTAVALLRNSDIAMYHAKNAGGNRPIFFDLQMSKLEIERIEIENELRKSIESGYFELYYQPKYELKTALLKGFEALIRWNHPELGRIPPLKFIPIAEQTHLIIPLGTWVLREACRQNIEWEKRGLGMYQISVNVSVIQFVQDDFIQIVRQALEDYRLPPDRLELEITESVVINDLRVISDKISALKHLGVHTAVDDFGTGYSSMSYLHQLPVSCLKIDRSFVNKLTGEKDECERSKLMLKTIVELAHSLNFTVVAEGPETKEQISFLKDIECDYGQGFYFSVPLSAKEIEKCLGEMK